VGYQDFPQPTSRYSRLWTLTLRAAPEAAPAVDCCRIFLPVPSAAWLPCRLTIPKSNPDSKLLRDYATRIQKYGEQFQRASSRANANGRQRARTNSTTGLPGRRSFWRGMRTIGKGRDMRWLDKLVFRVFDRLHGVAGGAEEWGDRLYGKSTDDSILTMTNGRNSSISLSKARF